ncbi:PREDICTED: melanoma-associated antigen 10-like [Chinchilla lanigera]|uniref:melanoma-associated antigen 10-like n=1 Tax=Chinchilla lanigera TaxID=34839 RepID=UPI00038EE12B|nr:PREDICTED: melanoma-associated antigen 10-like [Chinchilla lanigera]
MRALGHWSSDSECRASDDASGGCRIIGCSGDGLCGSKEAPVRGVPTQAKSAALISRERHRDRSARVSLSPSSLEGCRVREGGGPGSAGNRGDPSKEAGAEHPAPLKWEAPPPARTFPDVTSAASRFVGSRFVGSRFVGSRFVRSQRLEGFFCVACVRCGERRRFDMGNCICCQARVAKGRTERTQPQPTQAARLHLCSQRETVALACKLQVQGQPASVCSVSPGQQRGRASPAERRGQDLPVIKVFECPSPPSCLRSHTIAFESGASKPYQVEDDTGNQSVIEEFCLVETLDPEGGISILCTIEEISLAETLDSEEGFSPPSTRAPTPLSQSHPGSSSEQGQSSSPLESESDTDSLIINGVEGKLVDLMQFLAFKYLSKEPTTILEMERVVSRDYEGHFPGLFREASQYLQLIFGIEIKKVHPCSPFYVLVPALGLTYDGMFGNDQGYPRTIFLIIVLGIIYIQGNRASEEVIWEVLSEIEVHPGRKHIIYGEPRKFLTEDLVQEQYLTCLEVPNSSPLQYEFLWGPRAFAETSSREVLEFLGRLKDTTLRVFTIGEEEDSEDED